MSARDRILAKLRSENPTNSPSTVSDLSRLPNVADWYATHRTPESGADKARRFRQCIELAHAEVYSVNRASWLQKLWEVLAAKEIKRILLATGTEHGVQAAEILTGLGVECTAYSEAIEAGKDVMFRHIPASLTAARGAIAETGTLILWPDANEPRLMSLVPPVHIVLLDATTIYNTFHEAMTSENWKDGLPTNALLISGPSKTADIQQTLAYGAHGPKELVVLMIEGEAA